MADLAAALREVGHLVSEAPPSEARAVLPLVAALALTFAARAAELAPEALAPAQVEGDLAVWLNRQQVERIYGLPAAWLQEHARELEQAGTVAKVSRKLRIYHRAKLGRWIEARRAVPKH